MPDRIILGIADSLRSASYSRAALRAAGELLPHGWRLEIFDLDGIPPFLPAEEARPPRAVTELKRQIRSADAILFVSPEYNNALPGVLKNAIDWASRPLGDSAWQYKPVAILGASVSVVGTVRAQLHLREVCVYLEMHPVNRQQVTITEASHKFDASGALVDLRSRGVIRVLLESLADWTDTLAGSPLSPQL